MCGAGAGCLAINYQSLPDAQPLNPNPQPHPSTPHRKLANLEPQTQPPAPDSAVLVIEDEAPLVGHWGTYVTDCVVWKEMGQAPGFRGRISHSEDSQRMGVRAGHRGPQWAVPLWGPAGSSVGDGGGNFNLLPVRSPAGRFDRPGATKWTVWERRLTLPRRAYMGTSLIRNNPPVGTFCSPVPRYLW